MGKSFPHRIARKHLFVRAPHPIFFDFLPDRLDTLKDRRLGAAVQVGDFRIAHAVQRIEQKSAALCLGAAIQNRKQLVQRFFSTEIVLREFAEHAHALGKDDALVKLAPIPMTPLFVGEVFFLVVGTVKKLINFNADLYGHELPAVIDGNFHPFFLRSDFF